MKAVPSAQDSSDRRSDFSGRTEELTQTLTEGCHLLYASLNTCEYQKPLGTLVREEKKKKVPALLAESLSSQT